MWYKIKGFFTERLNSYQKVFTILGCLFGLGLAIGLVSTGIASIPFTGGLPAWLGIAIFITLATGSAGSAGKYIGLSVDTLMSDEPWNNEKAATLAGCVLGLTISLLAIPFNYISVDLISEAASIPAWQALMIFIPFMTGTFGSACSYIGRSVDYITNDRLVIDLGLRKDTVLKNAIKNKLTNKKEVIEELSEELSSTEDLTNIPRRSRASTRSTSPSSESKSRSVTRSGSRSRNRSRSGDRGAGPLVEMEHSEEQPAIDPVANTIPISTTALVMQRYVARGRGHLGCCNFDSERGTVRADTYQLLLQNADNDFQKLIIIYALLASADGTTLKEMVSEHLGFGKDVAAARKKCADLIVQEAASRIECVDSAIYNKVKDKAENKAYVEERATLSWKDRADFMFSGQAAELALKEKSRSRMPDADTLKEKAYLKELRHKVITPLFKHVNNKQRSDGKAIQDTFKHLKRLAPTACP